MYNSALCQAKNQQEILEILVEHSLHTLKADLAGIYLTEGAQLTYFVSLEHNEFPPNILTPTSDHLFFDLLQAKGIQFLTLANNYDSDCKLWGYFRDQQIQSILVISLRTEDRLVGMLYLGYRTQNQYTDDDIKLLSLLIELSSNTLHHIQVTEQLLQKVSDREHELNVLCEVVAIAGEAKENEALLDASLTATLQATNCQIGVIHLNDPVTQRLNIAACHQFADELHTWLELSGLAKELWGRSYDQRTTVHERNLRTQSYAEITHPKVTLLNYLGAPIRAKEKILGVLSIFSESEQLLSPGIADLVSTIADQIGLALESNRLHKHAEENLVHEERQRLARDLHDSISQSLYGLVLAADASRKLLQIQEYAELEKTLANIDEASRQSLKEMRLMLFELRPLSLETEGLVKALELRLNSVERRAEVDVELVIEGEEELPILLKTEIYRIATEALNNSLKHAEATRVLISIIVQENKVTLEVADNGKGFDPAAAANGGMGLLSMNERAGRISGILEIDSAPGKGTKVRLKAPVRAGCKA
jgi:signal transduction histidine kinase